MKHNFLFEKNNAFCKLSNQMVNVFEVAVQPYLFQNDPDLHQRENVELAVCWVKSLSGARTTDRFGDHV